MKRYVALTLCIFFLLGGVAKALGNCLAGDHHALGEEHHRVASDQIGGGGNARDKDESTLLHCPETRFEMAMVRLSSTLDIKRLVNEDRFYRHRGSVAHGTASGLIPYMARGGGNIPITLYQTSLSPHLFHSVLRI